MQARGDITYRTLPDEAAGPRSPWDVGSGNYTHPPGALRRVRDLARWDMICRMLGYPPMRLMVEA